MKFLWFLIPDPDLVSRCSRRLQSWSSLCQWWEVTEKTRWWRPRRISTAGMSPKTSAHGGDSGEDRATRTRNAATSFPTVISRKLVSSTLFPLIDLFAALPLPASTCLPAWWFALLVKFTIFFSVFAMAFCLLDCCLYCSEDFDQNRGHVSDAEVYRNI